MTDEWEFETGEYGPNNEIDERLVNVDRHDGDVEVVGVKEAIKQITQS